MARKLVQTEIFQLRADPLTIQKLDQLARETGGNRSEAVRQLIDQAANQAKQPQPQKVGV